MDITLDPVNPSGVAAVGASLIFDINVKTANIPSVSFEWLVAGDPAIAIPTAFFYPPTPYVGCIPPGLAGLGPLFSFGSTPGTPAGCSTAGPPTAFVGTVATVTLTCSAVGASELVLDGPEFAPPFAGLGTTTLPVPLGPGPAFPTELGPLPQAPPTVPGAGVFVPPFVAAAPYSCIDPCPEDLDQNTGENGGLGKVSFADLLLFATDYNAIPTSANWNGGRSDFHTEAMPKVGFDDLLLFAKHYNQTIAACAATPP